MSLSEQSKTPVGRVLQLCRVRRFLRSAICYFHLLFVAVIPGGGTLLGLEVDCVNGLLPTHELSA